LLTWNLSDALPVQGGLTNSWDTFDFALGDKLNFLTGLKYTGASGWWSSFVITTGPNVNNPSCLAIPGRADEPDALQLARVAACNLTARLCLSPVAGCRGSGYPRWWSGLLVRTRPVPVLHDQPLGELAFGLNWIPTNNLTVRPEIRTDWFDGDQARQPFNDGTDDSQLMLGLDAIWQF
jgi:hypothetical protein